MLQNTNGQNVGTPFRNLQAFSSIKYHLELTQLNTRLFLKIKLIMHIGKCSEIILLTLCATSIVSHLQMLSFEIIKKKSRIQNIVSFCDVIDFFPSVSVNNKHIFLMF